MILSKHYYDAAARANKIDEILFNHKKNTGHTLRNPSFFPLFAPRQEFNPKYPNGPALITTEEGTPGMDLRSYVQTSHLCCGFAEISSPSSCYYHAPNFPKEFHALKYSPEEIREAHSAYVLQTIFTNLYGRGIVVYNAPTAGGYSQQIALYKKFGFSKMFSFANPMHSGHEVETLVCHTPAATAKWGKGHPAWLDSSITKAAELAGPAITSVSTTTEVNTASAAIGGRSRTKKVA